MKKILLLIGLAVALTGIAYGISKTYVTQTATHATASTVVFNADSTKQWRIVSVISSSDKAGSVLSFRTGTGAYLITATNAAASTNLYVSSVSGLASNDVVLLQTAAGAVTNATVWGTQNVTNVQLTAAIGLANTAGDQLYELSAATTLSIGAVSNVVYASEAVYVGTWGRPLRVVLDSTSVGTIHAITAVGD